MRDLSSGRCIGVTDDHAVASTCRCVQAMYSVKAAAVPAQRRGVPVHADLCRSTPWIPSSITASNTNPTGSMAVILLRTTDATCAVD